jgi:hypothetical protein
MSKLEHLNPGQKFQRIKIFETDLLDEFENEQQTGEISDVLDEELQDLVDHHLLIIPIFVNS